MTKDSFENFVAGVGQTSQRIFVQTSCLKKEQYCPNLGFYNQIIFFEERTCHP